VDDGKSAKTLERPGMQRVLEMVRKRAVDAVIVAKLDRLTRSVRDLAEIVDLAEKKRVALVSVAETLDTGTAAGRMVLNVMASVAQWEREAIAERTTDALREKRRMGQRAGNVPYGYALQADGKTLVEDPEESAVIWQMRRWREEGATLRGIADKLNQHGVRTRSGSAWRFQYVDRVLGGDAFGA
jgi:site-specific DNA recombinase